MNLMKSKYNIGAARCVVGGLNSISNSKLVLLRVKKVWVDYKRITLVFPSRLHFFRVMIPLNLCYSPSFLYLNSELSIYLIVITESNVSFSHFYSSLAMNITPRLRQQNGSLSYIHQGSFTLKVGSKSKHAHKFHTFSNEY